MTILTVLMPVYNSEKYLKEAIDSILNQTLVNFEFLIIDDGSTDNSRQIIESFNDKRIRLVKHNKNQGLIKTLNEGLKLAQGEYIARMDSDDIAYPQRLKTELDFLLKNPEFIIVGTGANVISDSNKFIKYQPVLETDEAIKLSLYVTCPFIHPTVMYLKSKIMKVGGYSANALHIEDYDLWLRLADLGEFANINQPLIKYRLNASGVTQSQRSNQLFNFNHRREELWKIREKITKQDWNKILPKRKLLKEENEYFSLLYFAIALLILRQHRSKSAILYFLKSFGLSPGYVIKTITGFNNA